MIITVLFLFTLAFILKLAIDHFKWCYVNKTTDFENDIFIKTNYESRLIKNSAENINLEGEENEKETFTIE